MISENPPMAIAGIEHIPTLLFNDILDGMLREGWKKISEYDQSTPRWTRHVVLQKDTDTLTFEWDN